MDKDIIYYFIFILLVIFIIFAAFNPALFSIVAKTPVQTASGGGCISCG